MTRRVVDALRASAFTLLALAIIGYAAYSGLHANDSPDPPEPAAPPPAQTTPSDAPQPRQSARKLFADTCSACHRLRAAGATGGVGPDLDRAAPLRAGRVREQIRTGSLDSSMPAGLLTGEDADRVARYVARVARRR